MRPRKSQLVIEDLRNHSPEHLSELRLLLDSGAFLRPDPRRPHFFEVAGDSSTYYIFKFPTNGKILLLAVWQRDPVAELVGCTCPAA